MIGRRLGMRLKLIKSTRMENAAAAAIYAVMFILLCVICFGSNEYMYSLHSDVQAVSYPQMFRLKEFYLSIFSGNAEFMDYNVLFGTDHLLNVGLIGNPLYFPVIFFPDDKMDLFFNFYFIGLMFLAGISFMLMCRYFGRSSITSALGAVLYVFSPFVLSIGIIFSNFPANLVIFPLMIIGMESIFRGGRGFALTLVSFLAAVCCGMYFYVYQLFLTVLYALFRVCFMKEKTFIKRLFGYGLKGAFHAISGLCIAGVFIVPQLAETLSSGRSIGLGAEQLMKAAAPDYDSLINWFSAAPGVLHIFSPGAVMIPFVCIALISRRTHPSKKAMLFASMLMVYIPFFAAALCGFSYVEHRWSFATALLCAYTSVWVIDTIAHADETEKILSAFMLPLWLLSLEGTLAPVFTAAMLLYAVLLQIPAVYRSAERLICMLRNQKRSMPKVIAAAAAILSAVFLILLNADILYAVISVLCAAVIAVLFSERKNMSAVMHFIPVMFLPVVLSLTYDTDYDYTGPETADAIYAPLEEIRDAQEAEGDEIVRFESNDVIYYINSSYSYDIANTSGFFNLIPGRYMDMMNESGFDVDTLSSVNSVNSLEHRLPYMSVFGMDYITDIHITEGAQTNKDNVKSMDIPYGFEKITSYEADGYTVDVYRNNYSLPFGYTYTDVIDNEERKKLNGAEYGINTLYAAAVDADAVDSEMSEPVRMTVPFSVESVNSVYDEITGEQYVDYTVTLEKPVENAELYITLKNTDPQSTVYGMLDFCVNGSHHTDGDIGGSIMEKMFSWGVYKNDYTFRLGEFSEPAEVITFTSGAVFEDIEITALYHDEFVHRYEVLNEYVLEDVRLEPGEISGRITVPDDRLLAMSLQYSSGWRAVDNGVPAELFPVNECMTGMLLEAGEHEITLEYSAPGIKTGAVVSVIGIIITSAAAVYCRYRRKETEYNEKSD